LKALRIFLRHTVVYPSIASFISHLPSSSGNTILWVGDDTKARVIGYSVSYTNSQESSVIELNTLYPTQRWSSRFGRSLDVSPAGSHFLLVGDPGAECLHPYVQAPELIFNCYLIQAHLLIAIPSPDSQYV
jgi:hypothetical protein